MTRKYDMTYRRQKMYHTTVPLRDLSMHTDFMNGMRCSDIARKYGVSRERVRQIFVRNKWSTRQLTLKEKTQIQVFIRRLWRLEYEYMVCELFQNGYTAPEIANLVGVHKHSIYDIVWKHDIKKGGGWHGFDGHNQYLQRGVA